MYIFLGYLGLVIFAAMVFINLVRKVKDQEKLDKNFELQLIESKKRANELQLKLDELSDKVDKLCN